MASTGHFLSNFTLPPLSTQSKNLNFSQRHLVYKSQSCRNKISMSNRSSIASSTANTVSFDVDYYEKEFSDHGVSFESINNSCVIKMELENGSKARLMLPSGLITSYKPLMWHGGTVEVLHTKVSEKDAGEIVIQGGVSMNFNCAGDAGFRWSPSIWSLHDVRGSSDKYIQVELKSSDSKEMVNFTYLVTLEEALLGSELTITNSSSSSIQMIGSLMSHLTVSSPEATFAVGLQGSSYFCKQPLISNFSIIPPPQNEENVFPDTENEEDDDCASMAGEFSRIYTTAPRQFSVMDRGRRNSVIMQRTGFDELYVYSPGSEHEMYGKYSYVCIGPSATLIPVNVGPGVVWGGAQYLCNPNL
ncbi:Galactose mutarotase-like protein [Dioscorea alata]|uniref:Galactose mutarotase-like protein n=1 Tax=Dioscorea alata TaxID=55571 RepID=A0ACB7TYL2_DIOAL|nr:Galactose mutarotase-like protein [Dioscorea alata]